MIHFDSDIATSFIKLPNAIMARRDTFTIDIGMTTTDTRTNSLAWRDPTIFGVEDAGDHDIGIINHGGKIGLWGGLVVLPDNYTYLDNSLVDQPPNNQKYHQITLIADGINFYIYLDKEKIFTGTLNKNNLIKAEVYLGPSKYNDTGSIMPCNMDLYYFKSFDKAIDINKIDFSDDQCICILKSELTDNFKLKDLSGHGNHGILNNNSFKIVRDRLINNIGLE